MRPFRHPLLFPSVQVVAIALLPWLAHNLSAQEQKPDPAGLMRAVENSDVERVRLLLEVTPADSKDDLGRTPLMAAAKNGSFEICRALLWSGANANAEDKAGNEVREHLKEDLRGFSDLNLLLRCYSFVQKRESIAPKPARPSLVVVSDSFIDHDHAELKNLYWVNAAEAKGKPGQDDDKNGFIDDVYGWNIPDDQPLRAPLLANMADELSSKLIRKFVTLYNRKKVPAYAEKSGEWKGMTLDDLEEEYENPLVRQLGFDTLKRGDLDLNDLVFTEMLVGASHGTHVAGIVAKASGGKAQIHGMMHGRFQTPREVKDEFIYLAQDLAPRTLSYEQFVMRLREELLKEALNFGKRRSDYMRTTGGGVANLSWVQTKSWFLRTASDIKEIYEEDGMDPESIEKYNPPAGLDLRGELGLELLVNAGAELALMFHNNPDVLFVIAAGNEGENNDEEYPSPAYLSRFFPNVITVASVDDDNELSEFSNFGLASVQVAAPGENVFSTFLANQSGFMTGTSMAAPAVAGLAARLRAENAHLTAGDVRLIIERSVTPVASLQSKIAFGGVVNAEAALELAKKWQPGSRADLTLAALQVPRSAEDGSSGEGEEGEEEHAPKIISSGAGKEGSRITAVGGFATQWRVMMSPGTPFGEQAVHPVGPIPIDWIKRKWKAGWEITTLGGETGKWRVVMSSGSSREQKLLGLDFDKAAIDQLLDVGYRITAQAGYANQWVFALTAKTGWKEQRYTLPSAFGDPMKQWIATGMKEGYRITGLAGDDNADDRTKDCWVVVMTRGTSMGEQVFTGPTAWPEAWIAEHEKQGYRISQCSGYDDHWVVVMTQAPNPPPQAVSPVGPWDDEWVKAQWKGTP